MTLGERLVKLRNEKCLSQGALAEALGVSRQSVSKWETDASVPELDKLVRLSDLFEISLDELVRGKAGPGEPPVGPPQTPEEISCPKNLSSYTGKGRICWAGSWLPGVFSAR